MAEESRGYLSFPLRHLPIQGECELRLVSGCGGVASLTEVGQLSTSYLPAGPKTFCRLADFLYFSDWRDSYRLQFSSKQMLSLPLKGILCWSGYGTFALGFSRLGAVYAVDNAYQVKEDTPQLLPDSTLTSELIQKNAAFQQVNEEIAQTDKYIMAILLAKRNIEFSLTAQMLSVGREESRVCLVLGCRSGGVVVEKKDWHLALSLTGENGTLTSCHSLREPLTSEPLTQVFTFSTPRPSKLLLNVRLIFSHIPPLATHIPVLNIGKVEMDPSYFLLPGIELETEYIPHDPDLESLLSAAGGPPVFGSSRVAEKKEIKLTVRLSEKYPQDSVFRNLLKNSQALWRTSQWEKACEETKLELSVGNKLVRLEVSDGAVVISGEEPSSCYLVKEALFATAPGTSQFKLEFQALQQLENYAASSQLLAHMDEPPTEKLDQLRKLFREDITSKIIL